MMKLAPREEKLLRFLRSQIKTHGIAPSVDEVRIAMGMANKGGAARMLDRLEFKGWIDITRHRARCIQLVETEDHHAPDCLCGGCAETRYQQQLILVQAIGNLPPAGLLRIRTSDFIKLSPSLRFLLLGREQRPAPRTRAAIPSEAR